MKYLIWYQKLLLNKNRRNLFSTPSSNPPNPTNPFLQNERLTSAFTFHLQSLCKSHEIISKLWNSASFARKSKFESIAYKRRRAERWQFRNALLCCFGIVIWNMKWNNLRVRWTSRVESLRPRCFVFDIFSPSLCSTIYMQYMRAVRVLGKVLQFSQNFKCVGEENLLGFVRRAEGFPGKRIYFVSGVRYIFAYVRLKLFVRISSNLVKNKFSPHRHTRSSTRTATQNVFLLAVSFAASCTHSRHKSLANFFSHNQVSVAMAS